MHPVWLTFADGSLEREFEAQQDQICLPGDRLFMMLLMVLETLSVIRSIQVYGLLSVASLVQLVGIVVPVWIFGKLLCGLDEAKGISSRRSIIVGLK